MFHIEPLHDDDWDTALEYVFARVPAADRTTRIDHCRHLLANGALDPRGIFVAKQDGIIIGVQVCSVLPGSACTFWLPAARADCVDALIRTALAWSQNMGCKLAQALASPQELVLAEPLVRMGFCCTTWIRQLSRNLYELPGEPLNALRYDPVGRANERLFAATLEQTYGGTLDCPELNGMRTIDEILAGHRGQGRYNPDFWLLVREGEEPIGVVMLMEQPDAVTWELAYLGVAPPFRRRGVARAILLHALHKLCRQPATRLTLAVDERNVPAVKLYQSLEFVEIERNLVLLYFWQAPPISAHS